MSKITLTPVSSGIYWLEVAEADLRVLCGCPADSVKHLMKRGLIDSTEVGSVHCETGPNAILLSDRQIQNGSFANLAEFPVLQMLYRQGMLLPGHPNNTGAKPILIGRDEVVRAQMDYIYRGNYGLTSVEEILETGLSEEQAEEMMRLKLRFAFGTIHPTEDLLEARIVGNAPVEVRNGVTVARQRTNRYEFTYQGEQVLVDLNLPLNRHYETPYDLGFHTLPRDYFSIVHTGEGDGWDINRPCMASILVFQGRIYLIDAGPNIDHSLNALGVDINEVEGIFHTHAHDDHFSGLTTLIRTDHRLKYYSTRLVRESVSKKLAALMSVKEQDFEQYFEIHDLDLGIWNNIDGLE
ncbi:MAG TPA: MBL fold metallo-hydrolase, partial [Candidatus Lambdaproteobacteria bacterium]|nr:MBL fold metallo-hydrolase [Candidatus Lambdaproteobacteria bacterium]